MNLFLHFPSVITIRYSHVIGDAFWSRWQLFGEQVFLKNKQPPIQWVPGVKWPGREDDHSKPSPELTNA